MVSNNCRSALVVVAIIQPVMSRLIASSEKWHIFIESILQVQNQWRRLICGCYLSSAEQLTIEKPLDACFFSSLKYDNYTKE
jgi:hypothetical protein